MLRLVVGTVERREGEGLTERKKNPTIKLQ